MDKHNCKNLIYWQNYVKTVVPLEGNNNNLDINLVQPLASSSCSRNQETPYHTTQTEQHATPSILHTHKSSVIPDRKTFHAEKNHRKRMKHGLFDYQAKLDLHGLNVDMAYDTLLNFIKKNHKLGTRRLLVITGKGKFCFKTLSSMGKLIQIVPQWLKSEPFSPMISVIEQASHYNGAEGALYIILKKGK